MQILLLFWVHNLYTEQIELHVDGASIFYNKKTPDKVLNYLSGVF